MADEVRTGYVTQTHTGTVSWRDAVTEGARIGFDYVELYMDGATARTNLDLDAVGSLVEDEGLDLLVHLPFADLDIGTPRDRIRDAALDEHRDCIDAAAEMGAEKAVLHASSHASPPEWDFEKVKPHLLDSIRNLDAYAADRDIEICVENLPGVRFTIHDFETVFAETDAGMTFDTGHARVDGLDAEAMADFLADHRNRVSHVHANDAREAYDEHVPTGSGTLDFGTVFEPLREDWTGTISAEVYTFDFDYLELSKRKLDGFL
ncbi:sugar phosphate isomerase/epimerase family protein [Halorussus amylolyticus]|uniref:sugar phosphate isomerase/epimerase family protein n=1 Tax=Halorussus amylolyticus TaxID=1126242 RepID=UPI0010458B29|nr:sugar phosphate isomerase/epimerase family protein [Halorussus amylolyticus]